MKTKSATASRKSAAKAPAKGARPTPVSRSARSVSAVVPKGKKSASPSKPSTAAKPGKAAAPAKKPVAKKAPAVSAKPAAGKPAPKKPVPVKAPANKVVAKKISAKPTPKKPAKPAPKAVKPAPPAKKAAKPVAKKAAAPAKPAKTAAPAGKAAPPAKGKAAPKSTPPPKPAKATKPAPVSAKAPAKTPAKPVPPAKAPTPKTAAPAKAPEAKPSAKADAKPAPKAAPKAEPKPAPKPEPAPAAAKPALPPAPAPKPAPKPVVAAPKKIEAEPTAKTPRQLHFRMPAEWEPHYATWMTWPNKKGISFPGKGAYEAVIPTFLAMIRALITSEEVFLNVATEEDKLVVRESLTIAEQRRVHFVDTPSMEPWCRDHGATFVVRDEGRLGGSVAWKFNAWGAKYDKALVDGQIAPRMAQFLGGKLFQPQIVLEGGSIDVNGTGTVLTTESCLLNKNRNKGVTREAIEKLLRDYLNVSNVLWLPGGVEGDDTDGHIDTITRFVNRNTVVTAVDDNAKDKNHAILQKNLELLKGMKIEDGTELQVVPLPMPQPIVRKGQRLPATYANFYVGNKIVLLPTYDDPADEKALEVMVKSFPTRRIYPIDAREIIWGLGAFHCLTQQVPLAAFPRVVDLVRNPPPAPRPVY